MTLIEWDTMLAAAVLTKGFRRDELDLLAASLTELLDYMEEQKVPEMEPRVFYLRELLDGLSPEDLTETIRLHREEGMPLPPALILLTLRNLDSGNGPPDIEAVQN